MTISKNFREFVCSWLVCMTCVLLQSIPRDESIRGICKFVNNYFIFPFHVLPQVIFGLDDSGFWIDAEELDGLSGADDFVAKPIIGRSAVGIYGYDRGDRVTYLDVTGQTQRSWNGGENRRHIVTILYVDHHSRGALCIIQVRVLHGSDDEDVLLLALVIQRTLGADDPRLGVDLELVRVALADHVRDARLRVLILCLFFKKLMCQYLRRLNLSK
jgi:hypothetical protein